MITLDLAKDEDRALYEKFCAAYNVPNYGGATVRVSKAALDAMPEARPYPTISQQVKAAGRAAAAFVASGFETVAEEVKAQRLTVCEGCDIYFNGYCNPMWREGFDRSKGGCGCNMALKSSLPAMACPKGKW